ncbi:MAG: VOC family protein [Actinobacteria bacterium]|nr:VOC family protein [Actinomycetota bacterium]
MTCSMTVGHIGLCVPDIDAALLWYEQALGLAVLDGPRELVLNEGTAETLSDVFGPSFRRARIAHLGTGGECGLELFQFLEPPTDSDSPPSYFHAGFSHLCFVTEDIDAAVARVRQAGGRIRTAIWPEYPGLPYRFVHFEDPFGNLLEFHSHPHRETLEARPGE